MSDINNTSETNWDLIDSLADEGSVHLSIAPDIRKKIRQFADETKQLLQENICAEYLFGSYATHKQTPVSDIDILIIVKNLTPDLQYQLSGLAADYSLKYNLYISPIVQDISVWEKNQYYQTLFYQDVMKQGIRL
jgi:predicted nucleotidyltransferase